MKIRFRRNALAQLDAIFTYLEERNPIGAAQVMQRIKRSIDLLSELPYSARTSEVPEIRELPIVRYPYIVFYSIDETAGEVLILSIRHTSQNPKHHLD